MSIRLSRYLPTTPLDSLAANDDTEADGPVRFYGMGMAGVAANDDRVNVYNSDRPKEHINEAEKAKEFVQGYLTSAEGKLVQQYLRSKTGNIASIVEYNAGDLEQDGIVAAVVHDGKKGHFIVNTKNGKNLEDRTRMVDAEHDIGNVSYTAVYILLHELHHLAGYDENQIEPAVFDTAKYMAQQFPEGSPEREKYEAVAKIAAEREAGKQEYREAA